jgi:hypothetical protein
MTDRKERKPWRGTLWHEGFHELMVERAPPGFEIIGEYILSRRPRRADLLLLRRKHEARHDDEARILRRLWPRLAETSIVEFKSPSKGVRASDLLRLVSYGVQYHAEHLSEMASPAALTLVLVAPAITPALLNEIAHLGWRLDVGEDGYAVIAGAWYTTYAVFTNQAAAAEHDDYLGIFSNRPVQAPEANHWLRQWLGEKGTMQDARRREGYSEMMQKLLETLTPAERLAGLPPEDLRAALTPAERLAGLPPAERLAGLSPEDLRAALTPAERLAGLSPEDLRAALPPAERLAGLPPAERLAGLSPEEQILALSDEVLRGFSDDYVRSLPEHVQQKIRERLGQSR